MRILIIGSDSFIAQKFINYSGCNNIIGFSRTITRSSNEIFISDYSKIDESHFKGIDTVINFAAIVHRKDIRDKNIYYEVNHKLCIINAKKAKNAGVNLFIQMSTIAVYGNVKDISINTKSNPQNPYARSKLFSDEDLLRMRDDSFKIAIVRPPMVYGGGNAPGNMMRLIDLVTKGIPLPFKGIDNKRDFINVLNLVQYLTLIAERRLNGIFLVTDHEPVSTEYLLKTIARYLGKRILLFRPPVLLLSLLKKLANIKYNKLFGSLIIHTNFPFEDLIKVQSVDKGIMEMINCIKKVR